MSLNEDLAQRLAMIAKLQDLLGADRFRAISNERASRAIEGIAEDVRDLAKDRARLLAIDGIGPKIADKVIEFVNTGRIAWKICQERLTPCAVAMGTARAAGAATVTRPW